MLFVTLNTICLCILICCFSLHGSIAAQTIGSWLRVTLERVMAQKQTCKRFIVLPFIPKRRVDEMEKYAENHEVKILDKTLEEEHQR